MLDEMTIIITLAILLAVAIGAGLLLLKRFNQLSLNRTAIQLLQQQITDFTQQLNNSVQNSTTHINNLLAQNQTLTQQTQLSISQRLDQTQTTFSDLKGRLGQLSQATDNILRLGTEVRKLQDVLKTPNLRGSIGQWSLENLITQILPKNSYHFQYSFKTGTTVDCLIELAQARLSIDSKFPLANFQLMLDAADDTERQKARKAFFKDVTRHIDDIAKKYIVPQEGTLDIALMYIPSENVYYEIILPNQKEQIDISAYAQTQKVIPVSPNTLYAYLRIIATGLQGMQIEKNARHILEKLTQMSNDLKLIVNDYDVLGKHLNNAWAKYGDTEKKLDRLGLNLKQLETEKQPS